MKPSLCFVAVFTAIAFLGQVSARTFSGPTKGQVVISSDEALPALNGGFHPDSFELSLVDPTIFGPGLVHQYRAHNCC